MTSAEFPLPSGIPTYITLPEMRLLQHYAHEAQTVLEIGTHYGFSAIGMALAGAHVTSVDPHMGGPADRPDTWEPFLANCRRNGFDPGIVAAITPIRATIESQVQYMQHSRFGLIFIDGDHTHPAPMRDARIALAHLTAPWYVAFHDVTPGWMDVWLATRQLLRTGALELVEQERYLAIYRAGRRLVPEV